MIDGPNHVERNGRSLEGEMYNFAYIEVFVNILFPLTSRSSYDPISQY